MVGSRTATAAAGVVLSLLVSAAVWWLFDVLFLFFLVPFVPFLFSRRWGERAERTVRRCPECGFRTADPEFDYCPRDGTPLEGAGRADDAGADGW
ncbi:MAG: hypothetical protein ABEH47_06180 [Haloferacaceae archaeon]